MRVGIYAIEYIVSRRVYVGATRNGFRARWDIHRSSLTHGYHHCTLLQQDWSLSGPGWFKFIVLEVCSRESVLAPREQYWIDYCTNKQYDLYNQIQAREHRLDITPGLLGILLTRYNVLATSELRRRIKGMSTAHASNLWNGKSGVGKETMRLLHDRLGIPYDELMEVDPVGRQEKRTKAGDQPRRGKRKHPPKKDGVT
jgi:hypothetical protein